MAETSLCIFFFINLVDIFDFPTLKITDGKVDSLVNMWRNSCCMSKYRHSSRFIS